MDSKTRVVSQVEVVRTSYQSLVVIELHRGRGGQLVAATCRLQSPVIAPFIHHITGRSGRISRTINSQRSHTMVKRPILMVQTVRVRRRRLDWRDALVVLVVRRALDVLRAGTRIVDGGCYTGRGYAR